MIDQAVCNCKGCQAHASIMEWQRIAHNRQEQLNDLRAELTMCEDEANHCSGCNGGEWTWQRRADEAEAKLAAVEALCDAIENNPLPGVISAVHVSRVRRALTGAGEDRDIFASVDVACPRCGYGTYDHGDACPQPSAGATADPGRAHAEPEHEFEPTWCQRCREDRDRQRTDPGWHE